MSYQKRRRDYTTLGTSVVFTAFFHERVRSFFDYEPQPMFILVEQGTLYHFTNEDDARGRSEGWLKKYQTAETLLQQKSAHDVILKDYRDFLLVPPSDAWEALDRLHKYFVELLPLILVAIELPEHLSSAHDPNLLQTCLLIRRENEDVYKLGLDA